MKSKAFNRYKAYLYLLPSILILTVFTIYPAYQSDCDELSGRLQHHRRQL